jgi:hypothetical protein
MFDYVKNVASFDSVTVGTSSSLDARIGLTYTESSFVTKDQSSDAIPIAGLDEVLWLPVGQDSETCSV